MRTTDATVQPELGPSCASSGWTFEDDYRAGVEESEDLGLGPEEWMDIERTAGVVCSLAQVEAALARLPLPAGVADALSAVVSGAVAHASSPVADQQETTSEALLDAAAAVRVVQGFSDSVMVQVAGTLAHRAGEELLGRKKVTYPEELASSARERWRAKTKAVVAQELSVLTGLGIHAAHARVAFALAPPAVVDSAREALARGLVGWRSVGEYWQRCRTMDVLDAQTVSESVFGPLLAAQNESPDEAEPSESRRAESWPEFHRRLSREVTRVEGSDAAAARERRRAAARTRDVSGEICDDGLSSLHLTAGTASVVAALERIETIARRARKNGDPRPLKSLRSDTAMALLVHGGLPLEDLEGERSGEQRPRDDRPFGSEGEASLGKRPPDARCEQLVPMTDDIRRITYGLPAAHVDVIVPLSALTGDAVIGQKQPEGRDPIAHGRDPRRVDPTVDHRGGGGASGAGWIGEIPGHGFLTPEHARALATMPGSTWHRLLSDPVTGHAVERSTSSYRPDPAMIAHIRAVDRFCRAPGCLIPAHRCELDHEQPFGTEYGVTSTTNLNPKHASHHQLKTEEFWRSVMDDTRQVTWTTLFNRTYRTQAHDHRQYDLAPAGGCQPNDALPHPDADADVVDDAARVASGVRDVDVIEGAADVTDPDLRDRLIYAALSSREGQDRWLEGLDDHPDHMDVWFDGRPLEVFHRLDGRRRSGPPIHQLTPSQLLGLESADDGLESADDRGARPAPEVDPPPF